MNTISEILKFIACLSGIGIFFLYLAVLMQAVRQSNKEDKRWTEFVKEEDRRYKEFVEKERNETK